MAESDLIRGNVDTVILKVLYEGDRYGYDLIRQINERSGGQWEIKQPTVYACLKRLEKQGFVSSYWDSSESDGGRRKYYSLTESGKEVFIRYKNEFERANALFGGLISDDDSTYIRPADDFSDVEEDGYSVPKRRTPPRKRAPKPQAEPAPLPEEQEIPQTQYSYQVQEELEPQQPEQPQYVQPDLFGIENYVVQQQVVELEPPEPQQDEPASARQAVDPQSIIERVFAAENGESYSDAHGRLTYATEQKIEPPVVAPAPPPQRNTALAAVQPTEPAPVRESSKQITEVASRQRQKPAKVNPATMPMTGFPEDESPARREYKTVLSDLVERYEMAQPDVRVARATPATEQAAAESVVPPEDKRFYKIKQAARDLGNDVTIRDHNDSAKQYNRKYYYYSNRLLLTHYTIMCSAMFLVGLILFLTFYVGLDLRMQYDYLLYIACGLLPILMFLYAVICYAADVNKKKRINVNFRASAIIRCIIMLQVAVVIYCLNLIWGMPVSFSYNYLPALLIPLAYALFIPISDAIFGTLLKSENYAVE